MAKMISMDLRTRLVWAVHAGSSCRAAAERFGVSASCAIKLLAWVRRTGSAAPGRRGRSPGGGKLAPFKAALIGWVEEKPDMTMPELAERLRREHGVTAAPSALSRLLCQAGWTYKKSLAAQELERADVAKRRRRWLRWLLPWLCRRLARLVFIDETAVTTKMTRLRGRARRGRRLRAKAPYAKWGTQTFIAALRQDGLTAPWVICGAMDRAAFDLYVKTQLAPTLQPGDIVILDNLSVHKSARAKAAIRARGARLLFLPQYSPDLNPIEMALSKLKAPLRAASARTFEALIAALGSICDLFTPQECQNYFGAAGYASE
jgi:transposase